ncbi:MAG: S8 family serine peptidase [Xanthomonadales bacterium]|nr:S8 family serine peptidase [Xanthomonadales bacterium]
MSVNNKLLICTFLTSLIFMTGANSAVNQNNKMSPASLSDTQPIASLIGGAARGEYIIEFNNPPLASYSGGTSGIPATDRLPDGRLDVQSPDAVAYVSLLEQRQNQFINEVQTILGQVPQVTFRYQHALNGIVMKLDKKDISRLSNMPNIKKIHPVVDQPLLTDIGPSLIGAPSVWDGNTNNLATRGEGIIIGVLDSGINSDHASFAATDATGYAHINPLGSGNYLGYCATNAGFCNDKLIGAYDFVFDMVSGVAGITEEESPEDNDGHGSHTASTAGGNPISVVVSGLPVNISGVAPRVNIIAYDTCYIRDSDGRGLCPNAANVAAVNQAIADGLVNVINFSIGGGVDPYNDVVSQAFLNATAAGIFVSASAGNSGPGSATLGHQEPWVSSVAASTHGRSFNNTFDVAGPGVVPQELQGVVALEGNGPSLTASIAAPLIFSGDIDATNTEGCSAFVANSFDNSIAVIARGSCGFLDKANNASAAGAIAMIVYSDTRSPVIMSLAASTIPSVMISQTDGLAVSSFISANSGSTGSINYPVVANLNGVADALASFSSRGPNSAFDVLKPDIMAPGVNILAAVNSDGTTPAPEAGFISGTSMSSPHNAGAAALLKALYPTWSPAEIKSAMMLTADNIGNVKEDLVTPADPFDNGSGRIDLNQTPQTGLVMSESIANFNSANPDLGGDPKTLNLPGLMNSSCFPSCQWTRSVTNVSAQVETWTTSASSTSQGVDITVSPSQFTLGIGRTQELIITADSQLAVTDQWSFGEVQITPDSATLANNHMSLAIMPINLMADDAAIFSKTAPSAVGPLAPFTYSFNIVNSGFAGNINFSDTLPAGVTVVPGSESVTVTDGATVTPLAFAAGEYTWTGQLNQPVLDLVTGTAGVNAPTGFVDLVGLGVTPANCSAVCDETFLGFSGLPEFNFNGQAYTGIRISSNGYIMPGGSFSGSSYTNQELPDATAPNGLIAGFWADLDLDGTSATDTGGGDIYVANVNFGAAGVATIIQFQDAEIWGEPGTGYTFQIQLWGTATAFPGIYIVYGDIPANTTSGITVGVENQTGTVGATTYFNNGTDPASGILPVLGDILVVNQVLGGTAQLSFEVRAQETPVVLENTASITDGTTTLSATALTAISVQLDSIFRNSFEN